jgi:preprotein translocase subunit SecA
MVEAEIEQVVAFHTAADAGGDWNIDEIYQVASTIFPVDPQFRDELKTLGAHDHKLDRAKVRTNIIEKLMVLAREYYNNIIKRANEAGINWGMVEKDILLRSIDALWVEHLDAMSSVRQGIGLRGYGQRDPLVEYKKEAFRQFSELNAMIQKEVVYSIYKIGAAAEQLKQGFQEKTIADRARQFIAPAKEMDKGSGSFTGFRQSGGEQPSGSATDTVKPKVKDAEGNKVGRNDPCPCGSGKKYKKCCGANK